MSLWSEVKQRRITQVVLTYLAGGYVVLEVIDQVVDREVLPPVVYQVGLTLYLVGIAAALIIGWYHGEKGEQKAPKVEIAMLAVVGVFGLGASALVIRSAMAEVTLADAIDEGDLRSIGVLYLEDADGSMQAIGDGISEGLITSLRQVRELDVASRNASRAARELGDVEADSIARVLRVGALVDGELFQAGEEVRVSIRLVEGATGLPLFRDTYRWPMDDIAEAGPHLAQEISLALRERLGMEIRLREGQASAPNSAAWLQVARAERFIKDAVDAMQHGDRDAAWNAFESADEQARAAHESASDWPDPLVLRSQIAYERHIFAHSLEEFLGTLGEAVEHANAALAIEPDNAAALEWRGTARYRRWLAQAESRDALDRLFEQAHADLEQAKRLDATRASVHSTLSHLYYQISDWSEAVIAARTAYELDAFLDVADGVLWRLFTAHYDMGNHANAVETCELGAERFPFDFRFVQCQLLTMTMTEAQPDIDRAWELHDLLMPLLTEQPEFFDAQSRIMVGAVIGRAGLADSAQATLAAAARMGDGPGVDPELELDSFEAAMRSVIGDVDGAIETLTRYVVGNDQHAPSDHWWWSSIAQHPEFRRLRTLH